MKKGSHYYMSKEACNNFIDGWHGGVEINKDEFWG